MMMRIKGSKLVLVAVGVLAVVLVSLACYAQNRGVVFTVTQDGAQYKINKSGDPPSATAEYTFNFRPGHTDLIKYANASGGTIQYRNTVWPTGNSPKPDGAVPNGTTGGDTWFGCNDVGDWVFEVGDGVGGDPDAILTIHVTCNTQAPALTDIGVIVLAILVLTAGMIAIRRRRTAEHAS
jgi:hypothetical protein